MIRIVVTVLVTIAILALAIPAIDQAAGDHSESQIEGEVAAIEAAALSLYNTEEVPEQEELGPRRTVEVELPPDDFTADPVDVFEIERQGNLTVVRYAIEGRSMNTEVIGIPIQTPDNTTAEIRGQGTTETVWLTLERDDDDEPTVVLYLDRPEYLSTRP